MSDYISREAAIKICQDYYEMEKEIYGPGLSLPVLNMGILIYEMWTLHAADVRENKRGKWSEREDKYYGWNVWECSNCHEEFVLDEGTPVENEYHFCPNCGADMKEEGADDTR